MRVFGIKTHKICLDETLFSILDKYIHEIAEGSVIAITSKIVSICYGYVVSKDLYLNKDALIKLEADVILSKPNAGHGAYLTIKNNIIIPSAGVDESNSDGYYVLYPKDIEKIVSDIWNYLSYKHSVTKFGIIITDSTVVPLRMGVVGLGIGWCGFKPLRNYIGTQDIFNQEMKITKVNIVDALSASAVFIMGEGSEQIPIAIIQELEDCISFTESPEMEQITISPKDDLYGDLLSLKDNIIP